MRDVTKNYKQLQSTFVNGTEKIVDRGGGRDNMKFLSHLTRVVRFHHEQGRLSHVDFKTIPHNSNVRWNSPFEVFWPSSCRLREVVYSLQRQKQRFFAFYSHKEALSFIISDICYLILLYFTLHFSLWPVLDCLWFLSCFISTYL